MTKSIENPLVSIVIPVYNVENQLSETIQSALAQTWGNKEIIIVDDGSTDNSLAIAKSFEGEVVKVFHQKNKGASAARNKGLKESNGTFIQFLDGDDLLSPNKIELQLQLINEQPESIAICPSVHFFNGESHQHGKSNEYERSFLYNTDNTYEFLINLYGGNGPAGMITIHSWLTPKSIIEKVGSWNENISVDDDGEYFCRVVLKAKKLICTDRGFSYYRKYRNGNNLANQQTESAFYSTFSAMQLKEKHLLEKGEDPRVVKIFAESYFRLAVECFPRYKKLSNKILKQAYINLQKKPNLYLGHKFSNFIGNYFSWKLVRYLQYYKRQFLI